MHAPAFKWGDGATRRARWAKRLAKGFFPAHLAIVADDLIVPALFAQVSKKTASNVHTVAHLSETPVIQDIRHVQQLRSLFKQHQEQLLAVDQTYDGLKTKTTALFDEMWLTMNLPAESYHALLWALRAYTVLLAPWSPVQLRVLRMGPLHTKGFAIFASRDLKANEFIYELSGLMSIDFVADHTNLSVVTYPGESTKHILFGPIRLINHDCRPNVEFVHVTDTYAMTIQTNRAISQGEQLFIDYGREYWEDTQSPVKCPCASCNPNPPWGERRIPDSNPDERREAKRLKAQSLLTTRAKKKKSRMRIHGASTSSSKKKKKNGEEKHDANDTADRRREVDELL
ncbi:hypothetical protein B0H13DRAFT_2542280 [Mycena leptocephala]|nr:hypothetical protein B0H13DRAFT_2542280 [Mycena leptocephala]